MKKQVIAIDVGYGYCKAMTKMEEVTIASVVSPATQQEFTAQGPGRGAEKLRNLTVTYQGETYYVGERALTQGAYPRATLDRSRTRSREMETLFLTCVGLLANRQGAPLSVVTGLPPADFGDAEWMGVHFQGTHELLINEEPVTLHIAEVNVVPQGFGAYLDLAILPDGTLDTRFSQGTIGIIDVGYLTTDLVLCQKGDYVGRLCSSLKDGMSSVYRNCARILAPHFPIKLEERDVEALIRVGYANSMGRRIQLDRSLVYPEFKSYAERVIAAAETLWGKHQLSALIGTGGGILALKTALLERWPQLVIPDTSQFSNVRGYYKLGHLQSSQE